MDKHTENWSASMPSGVEAYFYPAVDSTNRLARSLASDKSNGNQWVIAGAQTAGVGRRGRSWASEKGNLFASFLWRPTLKADELTALPFVAALAVRQALVDVGCDPLDVKCKWPNDILLRDQKISGMLIECSIQSNKDLAYVILGIGVNLTNHPDGVAFPATNLHDEMGKIIPPQSLISAIAKQFQDYTGLWFQLGFSAIQEEWTRHAWGLGARQQVNTNSGSFSGELICLSDDGGMTVKCDDGSVKSVYVGDIFPLRDTD